MARLAVSHCKFGSNGVSPDFVSSRGDRHDHGRHTDKVKEETPDERGMIIKGHPRVSSESRISAGAAFKGASIQGESRAPPTPRFITLLTNQRDAFTRAH
ncbi:hypothetical protein Y032_0150g2781 [Ancylostoma ceylanicum]|uniref:Uncharacterized protein n=1 Tax=Ancylostoma ceylanicum TaxID=53326 RepID=A0A016T1L9_9BILA|nr:hypothetical protein Y032_0150g2781 [Ancylostoma ceylanicum]